MYLSAGFICLKSDVLYGNLCTEITFSLKPLFPKPTASTQCNVILITLFILLLTLNEPKEKEITTVQSNILGCWAKNWLEFYWQAAYKKFEYTHQNTERQIPNAQTIFKCPMWYLLGHTLLYLGSTKMCSEQPAVCHSNSYWKL